MDLPDLMKLDSAASNNELRNNLLEIFRGHHFVLAKDCKAKREVRWMCTKEMKCQKVLIEGNDHVLLELKHHSIVSQNLEAKMLHYCANGLLFLQTIINNSVDLKSLTLTDHQKMYYSFFEKIRKPVWNQLLTLNLNGCEHLTWATVKREILPYCGNIQTYTHTPSPLADYTSDVCGLPRSFVGKHAHWYDSVLTCIAEYCKFISSINLHQECGFSTKTVIHVILSCKHLSFLELRLDGGVMQHNDDAFFLRYTIEHNVRKLHVADRISLKETVDLNMLLPAIILQQLVLVRTLLTDENLKIIGHSMQNTLVVLTIVEYHSCSLDSIKFMLHACIRLSTFTYNKDFIEIFELYPSSDVTSLMEKKALLVINDNVILKLR
jgi:hypothetical protein